ncbi:MAG: helical backbone metal receptor [Balneolaceae bacterium]|nr:helical backbone metal receptor [Balneolaceae bacterium]
MAQYKRIISLVPSLTELLIDLGLKERLAGRTRFCVHPEDQVEDIPIIGGTKNPRLDKIKKADPDFILANKEENRREDIEELAEDYPVHVTDIASIEDALITIYEIGNIFNQTGKAMQMMNQIAGLLHARPDEPPIRTAYLIWREPWMTVGGDTYIHDVMDHWELNNVFEDQKRYPKITLEELKRQRPELVLLSSEPFPFKEKHLPEVEERLPDVRVLLVDGEWFSWYGSRMVSSFKKLNTWRKAIS